jgi:hypothetical protein
MLREMELLEPYEVIELSVVIGSDSQQDQTTTTTFESPNQVG